MLEICVPPYVHLSLISTETIRWHQKMATVNYGRPHALVVTAYRLMSALPGTALLNMALRYLEEGVFSVMKV